MTDDEMKRLREHYGVSIVINQPPTPQVDAEIAALKGRIEQADCLLSEWVRAWMADRPAAAKWIIDARGILRGAPTLSSSRGDEQQQGSDEAG